MKSHTRLVEEHKKYLEKLEYQLMKRFTKKQEKEFFNYIMSILQEKEKWI